LSVIRSAFFIPAVLFFGLAVSFSFGSDGVRWFWSDEPWIAALLLLCSGVMWVLLFAQIRKRQGSRERALNAR